MGADQAVSTDSVLSTDCVVSPDGVSGDVAVCGIGSATLFGTVAGIIRGAAENMEREAGFASPASFTWTSAAEERCGASRRTSSWILSEVSLMRSSGFSWDVSSGFASSTCSGIVLAVSVEVSSVFCVEISSAGDWNPIAVSISSR